MEFNLNLTPDDVLIAAEDLQVFTQQTEHSHAISLQPLNPDERVFSPSGEQNITNFYLSNQKVMK